jgi:hypothetical protein
LAKAYLGDSVYVELNEHGQLVLSTSDGISVSNTIYLEPEVFRALVRYVKEQENALWRGVDEIQKS